MIHDIWYMCGVLDMRAGTHLQHLGPGFWVNPGSAFWVQSGFPVLSGLFFICLSGCIWVHLAGYRVALSGFIWVAGFIRCTGWRWCLLDITNHLVTPVIYIYMEHGAWSQGALKTKSDGPLRIFD
jgi:hypothetical protein